MTKYLVKYFLIVFLFFSTNELIAQAWMKSIQEKKNLNFYTITGAFDNYWKDKPELRDVKGNGYKPFKRWEWYWDQRVDSKGRFPSPSVISIEWKKYSNAHSISYKNAPNSGNWRILGPANSPGGYEGLGRLNCIAFHPTDKNTFWVGSPAGGLWKTTDFGASWSTNTDALPVLGISDIAVDYTNPDILYIATGDGDLGSLWALTGSPLGDTKSIGILKSVNGGITWNTTGMNWYASSAKLIRRLVIHPIDPNILFAASSDGIYKTSNGGLSWTNQQSGYFMDLEFKPGDPGIVYASSFDFNGKAQIYRSINGGDTWASVTALTSINRIDIAVSAAEPNGVDILCSDANTGGLAGLYHSTNSGATFTLYLAQTGSNNLLNNSYNASGIYGQGQYDLTHAISPIDAKEIYLGGVNTWKTANGGIDWSLSNIWNSHPAINPNNVAVVHADKHFLAFHPLDPSYIFECNDGGLYYSHDKGNSWINISNGLQISQFYRIGTSATNSNIILGGLQDNGTKKLRAQTWSAATGGDGMECIVDYTDTNYMYASYVYGRIYRSSDGFSNPGNQVTISDSIKGGGHGAWVTPYVMDPVNPQKLYVGYYNLYKTSNRGNSWTQISNFINDFGSSNTLISLAVASSNTQTIYTANFLNIFKTTDGGNNWTDITPSMLASKITYIAVHPGNSQILWITCSGYAQGEKVYESDDGGNTWKNISGTLPNLPVNCIVYEKNSNDGLYIGTDVGVFYTNDSLKDWQIFNTGLPNVVITELEIQYMTGKLRAATFGRGIWESNLYSNTDTLAPKVTVYSPADDMKNIPNKSTLKLSFNEPIQKGEGKILINEAGLTVQTIDVSAKRVQVSGHLLTIDSMIFTNGINVNIEINEKTIMDLEGNNYEGISNDSTWNFTIARNPDVTPPEVIIFNPGNETRDIANTSPLVLVFDEAVQKGTGNIRIKENGILMQTIDVGGNKVSISDNTVTIKPSDFSNNTKINIEISEGIFKDLSNNIYSGILDSLTWNFISSNNNTSSLNEIKKEITLQIYPNPNFGFFDLKFEDPKNKNINIQIFNIMGQSILDQNFTAKNGILLEQFNLSKENPGIYLVKLSDQTTIYYIKVNILR